MAVPQRQAEATKVVTFVRSLGHRLPIFSCLRGVQATAAKGFSAIRNLVPATFELLAASSP